VLLWVGGAVADDRTILQPEPWEDLVALTAAQGVWLAADGAADLAVVLERWARPERRRVPVEIELAGPAYAGAQAAAAVARILQEFRQATFGVAPGLRARLVPGSTTHDIRLSPGIGGAPESASLVALVCEAALGVAVEHVDGGTTVRVARRAIGSGWLWEVAVRIRPTDEYDVELARLLHDLKNEVTGARTALGRPTATRTERREADLDASRHIDSAAALAARLVDAEFLYHSTPAGSCDLVSFLRGYCSDLINRMPPGIRVIPPVTTLAPVAVTTAVLRGALDNLVKNAVEAMGDQGQIEFEYTLVDGDGVVLLEVRDTGPGLPDEVVVALQANGPAPSSKRYGSGLGLPGVMRMMRRAGGDLQPLRAAGGGAWLISLPLAGEGGAADG
jgi:signal transduction histidine kinase